MRLARLLQGEASAPAIVASSLAALSGLASTGLIALLGAVITAKTTPSGSWLVAYCLAAIAVVLTRLGAQVLLGRIVHETASRLQISLARRILALPIERIERVGPAELTQLLTEDVAAVGDGVTVLPFTIVNVVTILGCLAYLAWLSPLLFAITLTFLILGAGIYRALERRGRRRLARARDAQERLARRLRTVVLGHKDLSLHAIRRRWFFDEALVPSADECRRERTEAMTAYSIAGAWAQTALFAALAAVVAFAPLTATIPMGVRAAACLTFLYLLRPLDMILQTAPALERAEIVLGRAERLGLGQALSAPASPQGLFGREWRSLELVDATWSFGEGRFTLGPIRLKFEPGELVFIVGGNGSGKSTLARVLCGLYPPTAGAILLDDRAIDDESRDEFRQLFSAVFPDSMPIAPIDDAARARTIAEMLGVAFLADDRANPQWPTDEVSQGQRRRLALMAAMADDRPIVVLDEWAAEQDPRARRVFYHEALARLKREGKLVVVITHDDRYFSLADRLIKLEEGHVVSDTRVEATAIA